MDDSKMRNMMEFIDNQYFEKIQVEDIAGAAGVSVRECTRCFSKVIGQSPIDYLNRFRIRQAAGMLVETDRAIGDISEGCGFVSDSYFGKMFK
jgi:transcriptional regulator GlxA family with amidase domain